MAEQRVEEERAGERADVYVARMLAISRSRAARMAADGLVLVNGIAAKAGRTLQAGDSVAADLPAPVPATAIAEAIPLDVVYEDEHLMVVNKPAGMVVHPAPGHWSGTLVNAALAHADDLSGIGGVERPGVVHRLDKDTSGLLLLAKTDQAHRALQAQIQDRSAVRLYLALVWGSPSFNSATIDTAIGRRPGDRKRMAALPDGQPGSRRAVTDITVLERLGPCSLVEARLLTGRTHQIRVHCAYIGHPVVGDRVYGGEHRLPATLSPNVRRTLEPEISALGGQALHAWRLTFTHPLTQQAVSLEAQPPPVFEALLEKLRNCTPQISQQE